MLLTGAPAARAPCRLRSSRRAPCAVARAAPRMAAAASPTKVKFVKYQGLGNDFILIDNRGSPQPVLTPEQAVKLCDRNFGIGGDGVIFALPPSGAGQDYTMRIFNNDGSEPEMCGNGIRCLARFVAAVDGAAPRAYRVGTGAGVIVPEVLANGSVAVDMGVPILTPKEVPTTMAANHASGAAVAAPLKVGNDTWKATAVSMGNPHSIIFANPDGSALDLDTFPLAAVGPSFENNAAFPRRTNTEFVAVLSRTRLRMRVWERGAGATLACGTGACATVVAAVLEGRADRHAVVELPGGPLDINWRESDGRIIMTGPAEAVFAGEVALP